MGIKGGCKSNLKSNPKKLERRYIQDFVMDRETYNQIDCPIPYVFSIQKDLHNLVYFGAKHCFEYKDKQTIQIENLRKNFLKMPNTKKHAFMEANVLKPFSSKKESIEKAGESGLLVRLATKDNIPFSCPEASRIEEVHYLEKIFSKEDIFYSYY